jgi:ABC-type sugar transport system ATPase subunit
MGTTVIYTTADYAEALGIADRVLVLIEGHARMFAPPLVVFNQPADLDVADMIGDPKTNFFEISENGMMQIEDSFFQPAIHLDHEIKYVGLRPQDIELVLEEKSNLIPGEIYVAEPIGYDQIVRVSVGSKNINIKVPLENYKLSINQRVWLGINWDNALYFDQDGKVRG